MQCNEYELFMLNNKKRYGGGQGRKEEYVNIAIIPHGYDFISNREWIL